MNIVALGSFSWRLIKCQLQDLFLDRANSRVCQHECSASDTVGVTDGSSNFKMVDCSCPPTPPSECSSPSRSASEGPDAEESHGNVRQGTTAQVPGEGSHRVQGQRGHRSLHGGEKRCVHVDSLHYCWFSSEGFVTTLSIFYLNQVIKERAKITNVCSEAAELSSLFLLQHRYCLSFCAQILLSRDSYDLSSFMRCADVS